ncbi:hypothetical protein EKD04_008910 [Chloroflexales bacterium ZM16-3]|nr:hypothetical protein [Chloroflexales bacterium ZM16-3]
MPDSDIELLSAYIDDQLTEPERAELERRLGTEPRLRAELEDLRATAAVLRDLEPRPLPRSFTLDPAIAPRRRGFLSFGWAMQLGGGLAGFALVLLASLQMFIGVGGGMAASAPAPAAMMAAATEAPAAPLPQAAEMAPASTAAPMVAAAAAPESAQDATAARNAPDSMASDTGAEGESSGAGAPALTEVPTAAAAMALPATEAPTPAISASGLSSPGTESLEQPASPPAAKSPPQLSAPPAGMILALGVVLIALSLGSFLYGRARR